MTSPRRTRRPSATVEKLRARLAEAEQTLDAIRRGEVDALVVRDAEGERIYSLTGAELPYRLLIEQMQEGAVTVDSSGQILYANARLAQMIGLPLERVIGRSIREFVAEAAADVVTEMIRAGSGKHELAIVGASGTTMPGFMSATALQIGGVPCVGLIVTDLTPQKHHEERLALLARERAARAEAETANRAKDEFLAILSHELRTPLNAIFGWARMLRTNGLAPAVSARALEVIERNALAQVRMIEELLDISRVITGKMRLDVRPIELASIVATAVDSMTPAAQAKGITLEILAAPDTGSVYGDAQRIQQVVWNLLSNAMKFTPAGGHVRVALSRGRDGVDLTVADDGEGVDSALLPYIFDRFRQGDSTSTREHGGLGIGLALVRHLIELHGGSVRAESAGKGHGATFTVTLPVGGGETPMAAPASTAGAFGPPGVRGLRVVVVDNDRDTLDLLDVLLRNAGMEVRSCASASEALAIAGTWDAQLLISDIQLPEMDGYRLIAELQTRLGGNSRRIRAIALTTAAESDDLRRAHDAGFDLHIRKPFEPQDLLTRIEKLCAVS